MEDPGVDKPSQVRKCAPLLSVTSNHNFKFYKAYFYEAYIVGWNLGAPQKWRGALIIGGPLINGDLE